MTIATIITTASTEHSEAYESLLQELQLRSTPEKAALLPRYFKTGKGEYGEGDQFLGVTVPLVREVSRLCADACAELLEELLSSEWHEMRLLALLVLVNRVKNTKSKAWMRKHDEQEAERIRQVALDFYLDHTAGINNWDLVDLSAHEVVGEALVGKSTDLLFSLATSTNLWEQRIAMVATYAFIRRGELSTTFRLAEMLLNHPHDLMHKAVGWMLREAGKRNKEELDAFLTRYATTMPRTMLRYAIEKYPEAERKAWLQRR